MSRYSRSQVVGVAESLSQELCAFWSLYFKCRSVCELLTANQYLRMVIFEAPGNAK